MEKIPSEKDMAQEELAIKERILRQTEVPNGAGLTYGEVFDDAASSNELEPGETFLSFVKKMKDAQKNLDRNEPAD